MGPYTGLPPGQGKVREFCKKSGKISVLVKVSEKSGNFLEFRVKSQGIFLNSGNLRYFLGIQGDFERKAFQMPCVQNSVKNVKRLNMKIRISMVYRRN